MVSNASDDFPEPLTPVTTISRPDGSVTSMFFRLCVRAPRTTSGPRVAGGEEPTLLVTPARPEARDSTTARAESRTSSPTHSEPRSSIPTQRAESREGRLIVFDDDEEARPETSDDHALPVAKLAAAGAALLLGVLLTVLLWPSSEPEQPAQSADKLSYVQFSSGSTRFPLGVAVTHRALMANAGAITRYGLQINPGDRCTSWQSEDLNVLRLRSAARRAVGSVATDIRGTGQQARSCTPSECVLAGVGQMGPGPAIASARRADSALACLPFRLWFG